MADENFSTETQNPAPVAGSSDTPVETSSSSVDDGMDRAIADAFSKRGVKYDPEDKADAASEAHESTQKPSGGDGATPMTKTSPSPHGDSGVPDTGNTGDADKRLAERKAWNRQQAAMRIARKQEKERLFNEHLARLMADQDKYSAEGEGGDPTMARVKEDQIRELQIARVRELQEEWERETYEQFSPEDAEQFLDDSKRYAQWINENEPELRQYMNKPYGRYLLKGWFDKVAKDPKLADKWENMNSFQKYQMIERNYKALEKFGEDYAAGRVQIGEHGVEQIGDQPKPEVQPKPVDVPVPGSGRNTNIEPPTDDIGLLIERARNRRRNK